MRALILTVLFCLAPVMAAAQTATAVLVTALLAPTVAAWVMRRAGAISEEKAANSTHWTPPG